MTLRILLLLSAFLLHLPFLAAQEIPADPPRFSDEGKAKRLSNPFVTSLAEDQAGFVWMGTARGLVRFDGHRFRLYGNRWSTPEKETSLFVRAIQASPDGGLWLGVDFSGLVRYDPESDQLTPTDTQSLMPASYSVNTLAVESTGRVWAGTDTHGLLVRESDGSLWRARARDRRGLPDDRIRSLLVDSHNTVWVGTWGGLVRRPQGATNFSRVKLGAMPFPRITSLFESADGHIWVGCHNGRLWRINPADGSAHEITDPSAGPRQDTVYDLLQVDADTLWIACTHGLEIRAASDGRLLHRSRHRPGNSSSVTNSEIRALLKDRGGQIWVGSYGGGVQRHDPLNTAFRRRDQYSFENIDSLNVRAITVLQDGRILLGTHDRGIGVLDAQLQPQGVLRDENGEPLLYDIRITALAQTTDGALWIGTDAGLFRREHDNAPLQAFPLEGGLVRRLLADPRGDLWIGTEDGLWHYLPGSKLLGRNFFQDGSLLRGDINALGLDSAGRLWIGGESGLALLSEPDGHIHRIDAKHPARSNNTDILGLLVDEDDSLWFDTPAGLFHLTFSEDGREQVEAINPYYDLPAEPFGANLLRDAQGRLWTQTHMLDPAQHRLLTLNTIDSTSVGSAWFRAYAKTADGILLFGGTEGLLAVLPEQFHYSEYTPPLTVTDLRINGSSTPFPHSQQEITLQPDQRSLAREFASLDYSAPDHIRYAYRLLGESERWEEVDAGYRVATFAKLAPGNYEFQLRHSTRTGQLREQQLSIPVRVLPAWWQTWWAQAGAVLLLLAAVHGVIQQRTRWLRARQHELERHVTERTKELRAVSASLEEKSRALEEVSFTDPLTGLRNRRYFSGRIDADIRDSLHAHDIARSEGRRAAQADLLFFIVDIDHFKQINDTYGHAAGDAVLVQVAQRLRLCFRDTDHLVRWGGEEFLVVARHTDRRHAAELADRVVRIMADTPFELPDQRLLHRSCSLGHASFPLQPAFPHQASWTDIVELADLALYAAKRSGRNGWVSIEGCDHTPLPPDWLRNLPTTVDKGQLLITGSLPMSSVQKVLMQEGDS